MSAAAAAGAVSDPWILRYDGFDAAAEGLREALTTLGNGYFATRGALPEARADEVSYPGTYVAGCFNRLTTEIAGRDVVNEDMVNAPNWLCLKVRPVGGDWIDLNSAEVLEHCLELDLRRGVLTRRSRVRDAEGRTTTIRQRRFVHYREQHLAGLATEVTAEDWTGRLEVQAAIDGTVENSGVPRYRELAHKHLTPIASELRDQSTLLVVVATNQSQIRLAEAARLTINRHRVSACDDGDMGRNSVAADAGGHTGVADLRPGYACLAAAVDIDAGQTITIEKVVALHTSRDAAASAPEAAAVASVAAAPSFSELLASHELAWEALWRRTAVAVPGDAETTRNLRLHAFHTFTVASPLAAGLDVGVPARGLHGEAYRGHIFWDELYILPFVTRALPAVARSLLMYRYRRLPAARAAARAAGLPGALFPWQSGSDGREETQTMHLNPNSGRWLEDNSHLQRHVAIAIAYNVYKYIEWTADGEFADAFGTELFVELLRFLAALASENADTGRFDIRGVMGPDEYHDGYPEVEKPGIDNNVYTNVMVAWMAQKAEELLAGLPAWRRGELCAALGVDDAERARWAELSRRLTVVFAADGSLSQFEGYEELAEFDWQGYREKYGNIHRLDRILEAEGDTANRYKLNKQADTVMLFYLLPVAEVTAVLARLGYAFDAHAAAATIANHERRSSHGSTLSRAVYAWTMAGDDPAAAWKHFSAALGSDLNDIQGGTTREGVHLGVMASTVDLVTRGYLGLEVRPEGLAFSPHLPAGIPELEYTLLFRGAPISVTCTAAELTLAAAAGAAPLTIIVAGAAHELTPGEALRVPLSPAL